MAQIVAACVIPLAMLMVAGRVIPPPSCHNHNDTTTITFCSILFDNNNQEKLNNIQYLTLNNYHNSTIDLSTFKLVPNITYLSISDSTIDVVVDGAFAILPNLTMLIIKNNAKFPNITKNLLNDNNHQEQQLTGLSIISNRNNYLIDNCFDNLINLTWLHIEDQPFPELTDNYLAKTTQLYELTINHCDLTHIESTAFTNTKQLEILSLNFNKITHFEPDTFRPLIALRVLELHHNRFDTARSYDQFRRWLTSVEVVGLPADFFQPPNNVTALIAEAFPNLKQIEVVRDVLSNDRGVILDGLRANGIEIVGTPHDCHLPPFLPCNRQILVDTSATIIV